MIATNEPKVRCLDCCEVFEMPATAQCECGSRQIRPVLPLEESVRDLLAELDTLKDLQGAVNARVNKAIDVAEKMLRAMEKS